MLNRQEIQRAGFLIQTWEDTLERKGNELAESLPEMGGLSVDDLHWLLATLPERMAYVRIGVWEELEQREEGVL